MYHQAGPAFVSHMAPVITPVNMLTPLAPWNVPPLTGAWLPTPLPLDPSLPNQQHMRTSPVELCPWLLPNPEDPNVAHIKWDMSLPPTSARRMSGVGIITSLKAKFNEVATNPPVDHVQIICPFGPEEPAGLGIPFPNIDIRKVSGDVTVGDILYGIYDFFNEPLSDDEVADVKRKLEGARSYIPWYESLEYSATQRARVSHEIGALKKSGPYRRIDCMGSAQRFFSGMAVTYSQQGRWWMVLYGQPEPSGW